LHCIHALLIARQAGTTEADFTRLNCPPGTYILSDHVGTGYESAAQHGVENIKDGSGAVLTFIIDLTPVNPATFNHDVAAAAAAVVVEGAMTANIPFQGPSPDQINPKKCYKNEWSIYNSQAKLEDPAAYHEDRAEGGE
jgi:hypothetical protein